MTVTSPIHDRVVRAGVLALVAFLLAITWGFPGVSKLVAGGVPAWFVEQFGPTFLASFPGLTASFYSIAVLESLAGLVAVASLLRGEFVRPVRPVLLLAAILLSLLLFAQLNFGKQLIADYDGTHDLFMYFAAALVMLVAVRSVTDTRDEQPVSAN